MARKSTSAIARLDPRVREAVDKAVREGRATIDDIVLLIQSYGASVSRSSVGRYVKNASEALSRYKEAQEISKVWIGKLNDEPQSDVARLLAEMLRTVAFQQIGQMTNEEKVKPMDIMLLAKGLEHLSKAHHAEVSTLVIVKQKLGATLKKLEDKAGRGGKITTEDLQAIRQDVYGLAK